MQDCTGGAIGKEQSRKPASLEARLEVFLLERPKGVVWVPGPMIVFLLFRDHFLDLFSEHFFLIFGPQNDPKIGPQNVPKSVLF